MHTRFTARHIMDDLILLAKQCMAKMFKMLYDTNPFLPSQRAYFSVITSHCIIVQQNRHSSLKRRAIAVYITWVHNMYACPSKCCIHVNKWMTWKKSRRFWSQPFLSLTISWNDSSQTNLLTCNHQNTQLTTTYFNTSFWQEKHLIL